MERPTVSNPTEHPTGEEPEEVASAGGIYDYALGGDAWTEADKIAADKLRRVLPAIHDIAWENRGFLRRAVQAVANLDVTQFIDIGSGLPTQHNTHLAAQAVTPDATVIYADNDPKILGNARGLLADAPHTFFIDGDLLAPASIMVSDTVRDNIDFKRPVALVLAALLHFVPDSEDPWGLVQTYMDVLPTGSYLILSHGTPDEQDAEVVRRFVDVYNDSGSANAYLRSRADVERFFDGLELLPPYPGAKPGVASASHWGAEDLARADVSGSWLYCGVGRKP